MGIPLGSGITYSQRYVLLCFIALISISIASTAGFADSCTDKGGFCQYSMFSGNNCPYGYIKGESCDKSSFCCVPDQEETRL